MKRLLRSFIPGLHSSRSNTSRAARSARSPFESLEARQFLSGAVLASVSGGTLNIRGDAAANTIVVDQTGLNTRQVRITGFSGTSINGHARPLIFSGITNGIVFQMGNG